MTYSNTYSSPSSPTNFNPFSGMGMRKGGRPSLFPGSGDGSTLNLDFTTGVLDPRLTFSRASTATFVNSSGYVEWAGANLVLNSTMLVGTLFTPVTSGGGTVTINNDNTVTFASTAGRATWLQSIASLQVGLSVTFSIEVTALTNTNIRVSDLFQAGTGFSSQVYNYTDSSGNTTAGIGAFTTLPGIGLYTVNAVITATPGNVIFGTDCNGVARTGSVTITRPQFQYGTRVSSRVYFANSSTAAAYHAPRFDYSPTNIGEPRGLLIEGQGINVFKSSEELLLAQGYGEQDILSRTTGTSPSNGTAVGFYPTTVSGYHRLQSPYLTGLSGAVTVSIWYKRLNSSLRAGINANAMLNVGAVFDLNGAGSVVTLGGSAANKAATITAYPNDWYRVTVTGTRVTDNSVFFFMAGSSQTDFDGGTPFVGVASQGMLMWGAQLEAGSASSYIPTGASQVTRNADHCSMYDTTLTGSLSWLKNATQGTFLVEATKRFSGNAATNFAGALYGTRATSTQDFMLYQAIGTNWLSLNWGASEYVTNYSALSSPFLIKSAVAFSPGSPTTKADSTVSINGSNSALTTTPNIALPFTSDLFCIGSRGSAGGSVPTQSYADTAIRSIKFYPFAMTAAQMNALTTL